MMLFSILSVASALIIFRNANLVFDDRRSDISTLIHQMRAYVKDYVLNDIDLSYSTGLERRILVRVLPSSDYSYPIELLGQLSDDEIENLPLEKVLPGIPFGRTEALMRLFGFQHPMSCYDEVFINDLNSQLYSNISRQQHFFNLATFMINFPRPITNGHVEKGPFHRFLVFGRIFPEYDELLREMNLELNAAGNNGEARQQIGNKYRAQTVQQMQSVYNAILEHLPNYNPALNAPRGRMRFITSIGDFKSYLKNIRLNHRGIAVKNAIQRALSAIFRFPSLFQ